MYILVLSKCVYHTSKSRLGALAACINLHFSARLVKTVQRLFISLYCPNKAQAMGRFLPPPQALREHFGQVRKMRVAGESACRVMFSRWWKL